MSSKLTARSRIKRIMSEPHFKGWIRLNKFYSIIDIPNPSLRRTISQHFLKRYSRFSKQQEYSFRQLYYHEIELSLYCTGSKEIIRVETFTLKDEQLNDFLLGVLYDLYSEDKLKMCGLGVSDGTNGAEFFPFSRKDSNFSESKFFQILTRTRALNYENIKVFPEEYTRYSTKKIPFYPDYKLSELPK